MKYESGGQIDASPGKTTLKKPSLVRVKFSRIIFNLWLVISRKKNMKNTHYSIQSVRDMVPIMWDVGPGNATDCNPISELKNVIKL